MARELIHTVFSLLIILSIAACSEDSAGTEELPSDQEISETIQTQLEDASDLPADSIEIDTNDGIVRLTGPISSLLAKQRATEIAEAVAGVKSVINNLKVAVTRSDEAIRKDVIRTVETDPATEQWQISTEVNNGMVTLTGVVNSWQQKQLAGTIVSGVKGVTNVENNIQVSIDTNREASAIETDVARALQFDSRIRDNLVEVEVDNDTVRLSGAVGSATEKNLAREKAFVTGVEEVDVEQLEVHPEYSNERFLDDEISLSASEIEEALNNTFSYDPRIPADSIDITIEDSTAILDGTVENYNSVIAAAEDAMNTTGINDVVNNITVEREVVVEPEVPTTDEAIKSRIENSILRDPYVEEVKEISVEVDNGMVELSGSVDSEFEKEQVAQITANVKGIIGITNNLDVKSQNS